MYNDAVNDEDGEDVYFDCAGEDEDDHEDTTMIEAEEICGAVEAVCHDADCCPIDCDLWGACDMRHRENYKRGAEMEKVGFLDFRFLSEAGRASREFPANKF